MESGPTGPCRRLSKGVRKFAHGFQLLGIRLASTLFLEVFSLKQAFGLCSEDTEIGVRSQTHALVAHDVPVGAGRAGSRRCLQLASVCITRCSCRRRLEVWIWRERSRTLEQLC